jgi:hypothetical protein
MEGPIKVKIFEVVLRKLRSDKSPATDLEEQLNAFLGQRPQLQLVTTHMNTLVSPAEPNAMPIAAPQHHSEISFKKNIVCLPSRLNPCTNI